MACYFKKEGSGMKVLITGANGFVGNALVKTLIENGHEVTALVRSIKDIKYTNKKVQWIEGDILDPKSLPKLKNMDKAFYLIHSLKEVGEVFEYYEAIGAVNFVNWIRPTGASIVYLGGLSPQNVQLSPHLRSRHLTGAILGSSGIATTEFRASIVLGEGSLSFEMIKALSERLPFRPQLSILNQPCQPLALGDLLKYFEASLERVATGHEIFEIGGTDVTTYGELLDLYSELAGLKRKKIKLPEVDQKVLMKALEYSLPEYANAGRKLTESLDHPTVVTNTLAHEAFPDIKLKSVRVAMDLAQSNSKTQYAALWNKDFLRSLLSDKVLTQSGLLSPELMRNLEKVARLKDILIKR
jgi:uncharacterized protein YbjT (DUF2867 family)